MSLLVALAALLGIAVFAAMPPAPAYAATIVVNSDGDEADFDGADPVCDIASAAPPPGTEVCTLRAAIETANASAGEDTITFAINPPLGPNTRGDGVRVILAGDVTGVDLPSLTDVDRTTINGRSQGTGANNSPRVMILPSPSNGTPAAGLSTLTGTMTVNGVSIGGFAAGIVIFQSDGSGVQGSFIGIDPDGSTAVPNGYGIVVDSSDNIVIGGSVAADRNVISNNGLDGVALDDIGSCGCGTQSTKVQGNYVGLTSDGTLARPNLGSGVYIFDSLDVTVGGAASGEGNVISGNAENGIVVDGFGSESNLIVGNRIGTNAAGTTVIGNTQNGIAVVDLAFDTRIGDGTAAGPGNTIVGSGYYGIYLLGAEQTTIRGNQIGLLPSGTAAPNLAGIYANDVIDTDIGGSTPAARNVISGNTGAGVVLEAVCGCGPNTVRGNYVGLNVTGTAAVPNGGAGVRLYEEFPPFAPSELTIGGTLPGEGNVISGNGRDGVSIEGEGAWAVKIFGNRIGTNAAGTAAVGNGRDGISLLPIDPPLLPGLDDGPTQTFIGAVLPGAGNVISGNGRHGILAIKPEPSPLGGTTVARNLIGVNAAGDGPIPNLGVGILFDRGTVTIVTQNTIANNGRGGVVQSPRGGDFDGVYLAANTIFSNQGLGIDLAATLQPNGAGDGISVNAPGRLENFPVIASATASAVGTAIAGTLSDVPANQTFRIELYASPSCDPSGNGEGATYLGGTDIQTDGAGAAAFSVTAVAVPSGQFITATSINPFGQTSEFSACRAISTAGIVVAPTAGLVTTEAGGTATFTVKLATLPAANVTIGLTSNRTAEATVSPASLTFTPANGTTEQTVTVTGVADTTADGNQAFIIETAPAVSADPAYNGVDAANVNGQNQDAPNLPTLSIQPATIVEGTGGMTNMPFQVTLSPASIQTVTVSWEVIDGTARAGADLAASDRIGSLSFAPGETSKPIVIRVIGDTLAEGVETFSVRISNANNAALGITSATGTIIDDDQAPSSCSPRPNISVTTSRTGTDQLLVTVRAGYGELSKITFASQAKPMQNATVETIGPSGVIQGFGTFTPPSGVNQQAFIVRRLAAGQPVMVTLTIEDACGPWTTFVGAGLGAF